ncbi:MAG: hypothetical protein ACRC33_05795, partial [Gemmataceae bacterium]
HGALLLPDTVRELFGDPPRWRVIDPLWLSVNDGAAGRLARAAYDRRSFDLLPVLADALEEAGCADADLLAHLRSPGPHVRGCWALDLLLGFTGGPLAASQHAGFGAAPGEGPFPPCATPRGGVPCGATASSSR